MNLTYLQEYDTKNYPRCDLLTTHEKLINDKPRCQDIINPPSVLNKTKVSLFVLYATI